MNNTVIINKFYTKHKNQYDYSLVQYNGYDKKVKIICQKHGIFEKSPTLHLRGQGCPTCSRESLSKKYRKTKQEFINQSKKKHGDKYKYYLVQYVNSKTKVILICPIHGKFQQTPAQHLKAKHGCYQCARDAIGLYSQKPQLNNSFADRNPDKVAEFNIQKNNCTAFDIRYGSEQKYWWKCPKCQHDWQCCAKQRHGQEGTGCPKCRSSKGELKIQDWLEAHSLQYKIQYTIDDCKNHRPLPFDFCVQWNGKIVLIEYQGIQHYKPMGYVSNNQHVLKQIKKRDQIKLKYCKKNKIKLLLIKYTDYNRINDILSHYLN